MIDVHANLDFYSREKLLKIIDNAKKIGVEFIVTNSVNLNSCKKNLKISQEFHFVKLAVGLYPEKNISLEKYAIFEKWVLENKKNISAIGEVGLDFSEELPSREIQEKIFINQLNLARNLNLPVIIHTRKAEKRVIEILQDFKDLKIILHFFSGNFTLVKEAINSSFYFSIPANVVRSEHFQKLLEITPKENILTETDSPYASPFKEIENEPSFVFEGLKKISEIWKVPIKKADKIIDENFYKIFKDEVL